MKPPRYGHDALRDPDDDDLRADARRAELRDDRIMADYLRGMSLLEAAMQPEPPVDFAGLRSDINHAVTWPRGRKDGEDVPPEPPADVSPEDPGDLDDFNAKSGGY